MLLLACGPKGATQPPEPAATQPAADPAPEVAETPEPEPEPEPEPAPEAVASADGGETTPESSGEPTPEGTDPTPEPAPETTPEPTPKPVATTLELPKPLHGKVDAKCGRDAGVGEPLKSFSLPNLEGKTITAGTFRGRVQVVNFWGTWCKPCLKELPEFDQLYRRYRKHGMTLLAIATDEDADAVKDTVSKKKLGAKIAIAGEEYAGKYGSPKFPFTFIVDHKGVIRGSYRGYKPECMGKLEADIREQLEVRAEAKARRKRKKKG